MARYYFHLREGDELIPDDEGLELPGIERARDEAIRGLADFAHDAICNFTHRTLAIEVVDDNRKLLFIAKVIFEVTLLDYENAFASDKPSAESSRRGGSPVSQGDQTTPIKHRYLAP